MKPRADILQDILAAIDSLDAPSSAREQFRLLVVKTGAAHGIADMARAERVEYARRLIRAGVSRATIRDRLMAVFEVSRSQAYAVMQISLNCPKNELFFGRASDTLETD